MVKNQVADKIISDATKPKSYKAVKYFIGFWLFISMVIEWLLQMTLEIVTVIHGGFDSAFLALQRKYNEYGKSNK